MVKEKGGFLTPKAIGNRIKAKGLQKLRWYCQMCEKQCRDENGFKCHTMSEAHQRQLLLVAENPQNFVGAFSQEFKMTFLDTLRRRFGTKRVQSNAVYQEYISDRHHLHMNATQWTTLTGFVRWLGKHGYCHVDHTEKGWFLTYIDRDPETLKRIENVKKKEKMDVDDTEFSMKMIEKQIALDKGKDPTEIGESPDDIDNDVVDENSVQDNEPHHELRRQVEPEKEADRIKISFNKTRPIQTTEKIMAIPISKIIAKSQYKENNKNKRDVTNGKSEDRKSHPDHTELSSGSKKRSHSNLDHSYPTPREVVPKYGWLVPGIVVKVIDRPSLSTTHPPYKGTVRAVRHDKVPVPPTLINNGSSRPGYHHNNNNNYNKGDVCQSYKCTLDIKVAVAKPDPSAADQKIIPTAKSSTKTLKLYDYDEWPKVETVIPAIGRSVIVVGNHRWRGEVGTLHAILETEFCALVKLSTISKEGGRRSRRNHGDDPDGGFVEVSEKIPYEHVCKLDESEFGFSVDVVKVAPARVKKEKKDG